MQFHKTVYSSHIEITFSIIYFTFLKDKPFRILWAFIYVTLEFRYSALRNKMWAVRKCLTFIEGRQVVRKPPRGVADLLTARGSTSITAVGMLKKLSPLKCWSVSTNLFYMYILNARHIFSDWCNTVSLTVCNLRDFRFKQRDTRFLTRTGPKQRLLWLSFRFGFLSG